MSWLRPCLPLLFVMLPALALAQVAKHVEHAHWTDRYDRYFKKYAKRYFGPGADWKLFKAQGIAESGLRAGARSPVGAVGVMQIMPATFKEIQEKNPHFASIDDPHWNIAAAIYYDRKLYKRWKEELTPEQRMNFAFASYNAGYRKVRRAFKKARDKTVQVVDWTQVAPYAPPETRRYVRRIRELMRTKG